MRRRQRLPASREPGGLYEGLKGGHQVASDASGRKLGRRAARDGWVRRFLVDVAHGRLSLPAQNAVPALRELARVQRHWVFELLRSRNASASLVAAMALGQEGKSFGKDLAIAAKDQDVILRLAGVAGLAEAAARGWVEAVESLGALLDDRDGEVRWAAAAGLGRARGRAGSERALWWLGRALATGEERAVSGAAFGAAAMWPARKRAAASLLLKAAEMGPAGLRAAALAMRKLPRRAAQPVAAKCREDSDPQVRALSAPAIARWASRGNRAALRDLKRLARDPDHRVRAAAAEVMGGSSVSGIGSLPSELSADASSLVRAAAAGALARRDDEEGISLLWNLASDDAAPVRAAAVRALGSIGVEDAARRACGDREPEVRAAAASALAPGSPQDLALLLKLSRDRDSRVVRAAAAGLGRHVRSPSGAAWERLLELAERGPALGAAAEAMAAVLDRDAAAAADSLIRARLGTVIADVGDRVARTAGDPRVCELARTVGHVLKGDEDLATALEDMSVAFLAAGDGGKADLWAWCAECAAASSLAAVAAAAQSAPRSDHEGASHLSAASRTVAGALRTRHGENRQHQLARAGAAVAALSEHSGDDLVWFVAKEIAQRWTPLIASEREPAAGPMLQARLVSHQVVVGPRSAVCVELENLGNGTAREVWVSLTEGGSAVQVGDLAAGESAEVEVPLAAPEPGMRVARGTAGFHSGDQRVERAFEGAVKVARPGRLGEVANPFVVGKPLASESAMFFGRAAEMAFVERALASGDSGSVAVLHGQRRTGKTSLLRRLEARLGDRYCVGFVDVQGMLVADTGAFFRELARCAAGESVSQPMLADGDAGARRRNGGADMVREAAEHAGRPVVLLLDEFDDLDEKVRLGRLSGVVFGQLRNLIQHSANVSLVLCGTHRLEELAGDHWSFLLNLATYRRVGCLNREEALQVLEVPLRRLGIVCEDAAVAHAVRMTGGHPYFLQLLGYRLIERCVDSGEAAVRVELVEAAADDVVEQGDIHLRYLWERAGPEEQALLSALSACEFGATPDELQAQIDANASRMRHALRRLVAAELAREVRGRYTVRMGLLSRWVRTAGLGDY